MRTRAIPIEQFRKDFLALYQPPLRAIATKRDDPRLRPGAGPRRRKFGRFHDGLACPAVRSVPLRAISPDAPKAPAIPAVIANHAVNNGWLKVSPFTVQPLRQWVPRVGPPAPKKWFAPQDVRRVLDLLQEDCLTTEGWARWKAYRLWAVVSVVAYAGLRATEALTLHVADVDLDRRIISVSARRRPDTRHFKTCNPVGSAKHRPLASCLRSKDSRAVLRGADGKGRSRLPVTAIALQAHELRHKTYLASRLPYLTSSSEGVATRSYGWTCYDWDYNQDVTRCATTGPYQDVRPG